MLKEGGQVSYPTNRSWLDSGEVEYVLGGETLTVVDSPETSEAVIDGNES